MKKRIFLMIFILILTGELFARDLQIKDILLQLKTYEEKISQITGKIIYKIKRAGNNRTMIQEGEFYGNRIKKEYRIEFKKPIYQILLMKEGKTYIKTSKTGELKEIKNIKNNTITTIMDIYQYNYFTGYEYKLESKNINKYKYGGYKNGKKEIEIIYNKETGVISDYYIIGNKVMPYIGVHIDYGKYRLGDEYIKVPVKIKTRVKTGNISVTSSVEFKDMEIR